MGDSKPKEPITKEEYLCQKTLSDKKLAEFARKPDDKKRFIDINLEARERAEAILRSWNYLREILKECQNEVRRVWLTANEERRIQILQRIKPRIAVNRRPDLADMHTYQVLKDSEKEKYQSNRDHYLLPQINIEVLSKDPKFLIDLLTSRSHHEPYKFARIDSNYLLPLETISPVTRPKLGDLDSKFLMLLLDEESYGQIVVREHYDPCEGYKKNGKACFGNGFDISEGLCIMEAQQGLLEFLVSYCEDVLLGMSQPKECDIQVDLVQQEPEWREWPEIGMDRTSSMFYGAPEMQMPTNFTRLKTMFRARHDLAMDHAWLLRINPGYFSENVEGFPQEDGSSSRDVTRVLSKAFLSLQTWGWLSNLASEAERLQKEYENPRRDCFQGVVSPPRNYLVAVSKLYQVLDQTNKKMFQMLRECEEIKAAIYQFHKKIGPALREEGKRSTQKDMMILVIVTRLMAEKETMWLFDFMDELEIEIMNERSGGKRVSATGKMLSAFLAHFFSDLGLVGIAIWEVWKDWGTHMYKVTEKEMNLLDETLQRQETRNILDNILVNFKDELCNLASPGNNRFNYPIVSKRSEKNFENLRNAERDLDAFWQRVDKIMVDGGCSGFLHVSNTDVAFWRTPECQAPKITTEEAKPSMPTRVSSANLNNSSPQFLANDAPYVMWVSEETLKVFTRIFQGSSPTTKSNKIPFQDFVNAMGEAGFRGIKYHVSMWYFQPEGVPLWANSSALAYGIMINEPWPDQKISLKHAYQIGQRLHKRYGFSLDMFVAYYNHRTHWIAYFDAEEYLRRGETATALELRLSGSVLRSQQVARLQAEAGGYYVEEKIRHPIWFGDICCSETIKLQTDNKFVVGQKSAQKKGYPILFGNWA